MVSPLFAMKWTKPAAAVTNTIGPSCMGVFEDQNVKQLEL